MPEIIKKIIRLLPNKAFVYLKFITRHKYIPNFKNWRSLNEYLNYVKLYDRNELRKTFCDRLAVREYVKLNAPEVSLIPILWIGTSLTQEVWDKLPQKFVIKAMHGSGMVKVIDKNNDKFQTIRKQCDKWLVTDFAKYQREWFYKGTPKVLVCEEMIGNGDVPPDFKFFVMNSKVEMIQVDVARFKGHKRALLNRDFKRIAATLRYPNADEIEKPKLISEAINIAEKLGYGFPFLRIDLYILKDKIYFGEITNSPGAGLEVFSPQNLDFELGKKVRALKEV